MKKQGFTTAALQCALAAVCLFFTGCAQLSGSLESSNSTLKPDGSFEIIEISPNDTPASLAKQYLNDEKMAWMIREVNGTDSLAPGQKAVIPLGWFRRGGLWAGGHQTVPVLTYHRFSKHKANRLTVKESTFTAQMQYLKDNGWHVISMRELINYLAYQSQLPEKSVMITVDDGWTSFYDIGYPILKQFDYPVSLFIYSDFINGSKALTWNQIGDLVRKGVYVQSHGKTRRNMTVLKKGESLKKYFSSIDQEINEPERIIKQKLGIPSALFAYPYGKKNNLVIKLLKDKRYRAGFTLSRKENPFFVNPFEISRTMIYGTDNLKQFKHSLDHYAGKPLPAFHRSPGQTLSDAFKARARTLEKKNEYKESLFAWRVVAQLNPEDRNVSQKIKSMKENITRKTSAYYKKGVKLYKKEEFKNARAAFADVLRYNPVHKDSFNYLKKGYKDEEHDIYTVKKGDRFQKVAKKFYKNKKMAFLIAWYNNLSPKKAPSPGYLLRIPSLDKGFMGKDTDYKPRIKKANDLISEGKFEESLEITDKILDDDYLNREASRLENDASYRMGNEFYKKKNYLEALKMYEKVDGDYADLAPRLNEARKQVKGQAEKHYRKGVKLFINEQLKEAIVEWEMTLEYDPDHQKAGDDIKKAKELLERLNQLD